MIEIVDWFVQYSYAQIAGVALFMAALHVYAWWTRGREHFLSELMVYLTAFLAFSLAQAAANDLSLDRLVARRAFALLAGALWVHSALIVRQIARRLAGHKDGNGNGG